jgi:hypothetical protein
MVSTWARRLNLTSDIAGGVRSASVNISLAQMLSRNQAYHRNSAERSIPQRYGSRSGRVVDDPAESSFFEFCPGRR